MPRSVPHLFARAAGSDCIGPLRCFYCGAPCDGAYPALAYVRDSFTGRNDVPCPGSPAVCTGCVLCLDEAADVTLLTGEHRTGQKMRNWSWLVTERERLAGNKAHRDRWRASCVDPPRPPFALVLADSGQKHLLYRGVVCRSREDVSVTLEGERVDYRPDDLHARLELCGRLIAASGKPALAEPPSVGMALGVLARYRASEMLLEEWTRVREEPLSRLAHWLSPPKERCEVEYPGDVTAAGAACGL